MSDIEKEAFDFLSEIEGEILSAQKEVAHTVMDKLFQFSPHFSGYEENINTDSEEAKNRIHAPFAMGEYDANHKVISDNQTITMHNPPTKSYTTSSEIHNFEKRRIDKIEKVGETITILNDTEHTEEVETGLGWRSSGYHPYAIAHDIAARKHKDILK